MTWRANLSAAMLLLMADVAQAAPLPSSCSIAALPGANPVIEVWQEAELARVFWQPPGCSGWAPSSRSKVLVSLTGSVRAGGTMASLVTRLGAISALPSVQYWSTTDGKWGPIAKGASALTGPDPGARRRDFSAAEFVAGAQLYYWEDDVRTGSTVYRMTVLESSPDRLVVSGENVTPMRRFYLTVFKPGALQTLLTIQAAGPGVFAIRILTRSGEGSSMLATGHEKSFVNRAAALYRHIAGIRTDQEPPAAR
ncbi:MAG: hypothetical protein H0U98_12265 [Alphaproteobacteria bacterium]|nr:hypothetical protein [Alphaproteobacteria bacterium]